MAFLVLLKRSQMHAEHICVFMQNLLIIHLLFLFDNSKLNIVFLSRVTQDLLGHLDLL